MGIAYSRFKPFTFEFDTTWTGWSTYDQLKVNLDTPVPVNGVLTTTITTPKNWHDSWAFRFGANYEVNERMKIRAGYIYDLTPVPDSTFDPQVPDANRHIFTVGSDLKIQRFTLGFAYNYILSESRTKSNSIVVNGVPAPLQANGRYNSDVHSLGLSWSFQF
jgi:long-chain fatty acid transport protein